MTIFECKLSLFIPGETVDEVSTALDEPEESDAFENDDDFNEDDLEALADPDELEALGKLPGCKIFNSIVTLSAMLCDCTFHIVFQFPVINEFIFAL